MVTSEVSTTANSMGTPLDILLDKLLEGGRKPDQATLYFLSNLDAEQAGQVRKMWSELPSGLRLELTSQLVEMAEADFTLNFGAVFRIALHDESADVRAVAVEGLWEDEDARLVPRLAERVQGDTSAKVRAAAAKSLGRFILLGELEQIRPRPCRLAYETLLEAYQAHDEEPEVQRRALESLAYICDETVIASIREAYTSAQEKLRVSAVFAMGRSADNRWEEEVKQELFSINPEMRYEAARACGELQLRESVSMLHELTEDADAEVQQAAIWALGQIGGDKAREILEHYCHESDEALRSAAEVALEELEFLHGDLDDIFADLPEESYW